MHDAKGRIHIYAGNGKGKTTAAVGLAVRARGAGKRVIFFQFMKGRPSAEIPMLEALGIETFRDADKTKFVFQMNDTEKSEYRASQNSLFRQAVEKSTDCDLLVVDELTSAVSSGMLAENEVLTFLDNKPHKLEVAVTGRDPSEELLRRAEYVSVIQCVRHPYENGVTAREGIEF